MNPGLLSTILRTGELIACYSFLHHEYDTMGAVIAYHSVLLACYYYFNCVESAGFVSRHRRPVMAALSLLQSTFLFAVAAYTLSSPLCKMSVPLTAVQFAFGFVSLCAANHHYV